MDLDFSKITEAEFASTPSTITEECMKAGIAAINRHFGENYARNHPELLAAFITAASQNLHTLLNIAARKNVTI